tara:strand:+ start:78 stop:281 length:204 start_codon:yes stop_codon:yes gene_type:complete
VIWDILIFLIAFVFDTGGSRKLYNYEMNINKLEHHRHICIPIDALVPCMNKTPDRRVPISLPAAFAM